MSLIKSAAVNRRLNIPISPETRNQLEELASRQGVSLAELGRQALESFLIDQLRRARLERLCATATRYADIIEGVAEDWRATEVEDWSGE